jgi:hypothetical protein
LLVTVCTTILQSEPDLDNKLRQACQPIGCCGIGVSVTTTNEKAILL